MAAPTLWDPPTIKAGSSRSKGAQLGCRGLVPREPQAHPSSRGRLGGGRARGHEPLSCHKPLALWPRYRRLLRTSAAGVIFNRVLRASGRYAAKGGLRSSPPEQRLHFGGPQVPMALPPAPLCFGRGNRTPPAPHPPLCCQPRGHRSQQGQGLGPCPEGWCQGYTK